MDGISDLFTYGIDAARDVLTAKYGSNEPTPNNRGVNDITAPAGTPAGGVSLQFNATTLLLLAAVGIGLVFVLKR